jgi:hypothetical protein
MRNSPANRPKHTKTCNYQTGKNYPEQAKLQNSTSTFIRKKKMSYSK